MLPHTTIYVTTAAPASIPAGGIDISERRSTAARRLTICPQRRARDPADAISRPGKRLDNSAYVCVGARGIAASSPRMHHRECITDDPARNAAFAGAA